MAGKTSNIEVFKNLLGMQTKVIERLLNDVEILREELKVHARDREYDYEEKPTDIVMPDPLKKLDK